MMKKKIFASITIVCVAVVLTFNINLNIKKSDTISPLTFANLEALANETQTGNENKAKGCETIPGANTGKCSRAADEANYSCGSSKWYQSNDCK